MKEYAFAVFSAALLASLCACISYGGRLKGATSASLCAVLLFVIIAPLTAAGEFALPDMDSVMEEIDKISGSASDGYIGAAKETVERSMEELVAVEFGFKPEYVNINIHFSGTEELSIDKTVVTLSPMTAAVDYKHISEFITGNFGGECEVLIDF